MLNRDHSHDYLTMDTQIAKNERNTLIVVLLTTLMMIVEIFSGYFTGSMALLADGWHMASHAGALSISLIAYRLAKSDRLASNFSFGTGKFIPLGGYTSAIVLAMIAVFMAIESLARIYNPVEIQFEEAIFVAVLGLVVNVVSAFILSHGHYGHSHGHGQDDHKYHDHHDHNIRSAYIHVIADALTSLLAILALTVGLFLGATWLDPAMGIVGSCVILKWAYNLCRDTGWELLDGHAKSVDLDRLKRVLENTGAEVLDLHIWKIAPSVNAGALVLRNSSLKGCDYYRDLVVETSQITHLTIEERLV